MKPSFESNVSHTRVDSVKEVIQPYLFNKTILDAASSLMCTLFYLYAPNEKYMLALGTNEFFNNLQMCTLHTQH